MEKDYYDILSVPKNASQEEIKRAYRKMALKYHPDRNQGNAEAEKKFKEAAAAYDILGNPKKRTQYDQFGHSGVNSRFGQTGAHDLRDIFSSFKDIFDFSSGSSEGFETFFGGEFATSSSGRKRRRVSKGADLRYHMEISLEEVLKGANKQIVFEVEKNCKICGGSGASLGTDKKICSECRGSGRLTRSQGFFAFSSTCSTCHGEGQIIESPCGVCFGTGRKRKKEKLSVQVPSGMETGRYMRLTQKGEDGCGGGPPGDLYIEIAVKKHPNFVREGLNLIGSVNISYLQAILGTRLTVSVLDGKKEITIPNGVQPGSSIRLKKQGLPDLGSKKRGDLFYKVHVKLPKKLIKKEESYLKEIARLKKENILPKK